MSEIPTIQAIIIPMEDTTISTTPESSITEHPVSESCKKAKMADASTTTIGDFISGLPDAVLCHILSYIPSIDAVATGVLSKRWNRLWTSVPNLDFSGRSRSSSKDPSLSYAYASLENLPMFNNLTSLKVEPFDRGSWLILPDLFHCTPNLVTLILCKDDVHPDCCWYEPNDVPKCFLSCLENIEVKSFEDCEAEMDMVYYFLENAMVLKKLLIHSRHLDMETEINILKLLSTFPRSSSTCHVEYKNT